MKPLLLAFAACLAIGCAHTLDQCAAACVQGRALQCAWASPTRAGATCETVCANASASSSPWNLACMATAQMCEPQACP